jgi:hypothetical protein
MPRKLIYPCIEVDPIAGTTSVGSLVGFWAAPIS